MSRFPKPSRRQLAVTAAALVLQAALQLSLGWVDEVPLVATAGGLLLAVLAGLLGGIVAGVVVAGAGWTLNVVAFGDPGLDELVALPLWLATGTAAGWAAARVRHSFAAHAAAESELEAVRATASDALLLVDDDGAIVAWSSSAEVLYGELEGRPVSDLFAGADGQEQARGLVEAALRDEAVANLEAVHRSRGGSLFPAVVSAAPARGADGTPGVVLAVRDVGELDAATEERRDLEARHRSLRDHLPVVTYVRPVDGGAPLSFSPQVEQLLGYAPDELVRDADLFGGLVHPEDHERVLETLGSPAGDEPRRDEYRLLARDGRTVWVRDVSVTVLDAKGTPLCIQGSLADVTAERAAELERSRLRSAEEAATAESQDRQRKLDATARAAAAVAASLDYERACEEVAALIVRDLADWCLVDVREEDGSLRRVVAQHGESRAPLSDPGTEPDSAVRRVVEQQRDDLSERRISVPLPAQGRRTLGALTVVSEAEGRTYTTRDLAWVRSVAALLALAVERARLYDEVEARADASRVLAYVGDGVFLLDRAKTVRLWNPAAQAITGLAAEGVVGQPVVDAIPGWAEISRRVPVAAAREPARAETLPVETPRGERWISISGVEFFGGTVYAFRDITEMHALDELQAEFIATASHELRTPLAAVYGAAQTLRRHDFALDEAGRQRFISMIVDESDRLGRIVNQILLANQLDLGRMDLVTEPFDAGDLVERVVESARTYAPPSITFELKVDEPLPLVAADNDMVRQVVVNLVENAIKYSPDGGRIELGVRAEDGNVQFRVVDEGLGIPQEEQSRIFQKFYRLDPDMTRGIGGTGLGLYICSELVERMGGRIWLESNEGVGSAFYFELPATDTARAPARAAENPAAERGA